MRYELGLDRRKNPEEMREEIPTGENPGAMAVAQIRDSAEGDVPGVVEEQI